MKKTLDLVANKWSLLILFSISRKKDNRRSFNEIKKDLEGITPKVLSLRLKELTKENILLREEQESKVYYHLTVSGEELIKITNQLKDWGLKYTSTQGTCKANNCRHYPNNLTKIRPQHS